LGAFLVCLLKSIFAIPCHPTDLRNRMNCVNQEHGVTHGNRVMKKTYHIIMKRHGFRRYKNE